MLANLAAAPPPPKGKAPAVKDKDVKAAAVPLQQALSKLRVGRTGSELCSVSGAFELLASGAIARAASRSCAGAGDASSVKWADGSSPAAAPAAIAIAEDGS